MLGVGAVRLECGGEVKGDGGQEDSSAPSSLTCASDLTQELKGVGGCNLGVKACAHLQSMLADPTKMLRACIIRGLRL